MNVRGFTLIELLVVVSIIILFSGLSLAAYNNFNEERKLDDEAKRVVDVLSLAAKKASSAETDPAYCTGTFHGYAYKIETASLKYRLGQCCNVASLSECSLDQNTKEVQVYYLPQNYQILAPTGNTTIVFKALGLGTDLNQKTTITLKSPKVNKCIDIDIEPSGLVTGKTKYAC